MMKRFFVSAVALMLAAAMVTVCAFAAPQKGGRDEANDRNGERPAGFQRENGKGDRPDMPDSGQKPSRPMNNGGFDFDDFGEKTAEILETVTDEELKAELNSLLEEYKTAAAALQTAVESKEDEQSLKSLRESTDSARKALTDMMKEAGIEVGGSKPNDNGGKKPRDFAFDDFGEKTAEILETVTDEELKAELNSLLEEYKTAAAALQTAVESKEDEQSLKSLRESTDSARKALANAMKEAGIEVGGSKPNDNGGKKPRDFAFDDFGEKTAEILETVTDEELKAELNSLLEEYKTAAVALQTAVESKEDEQSLKSLRESTDSARKTLIDAMKEAGIEVGGSKPNDNGGEKPDKIKLSEPAESEPAAEQENGNGGFFSSIINWFGKLFK